MHVMQDPVHGLMCFERISQKQFRGVLDHPMMQRLRQIKQMGMADLVFPGAVHTRFNHSIGVAYIAECVLKAFERIGYGTEDPAAIILNALLHDAGHGPFSHAFEALTPSISHEDWTWYCRRALGSLLEGLESVPDTPWMKELVSSQLDVDRMDYMLRDAHFCGVAYGRFDWAWLLHCLRPVSYQGQMHLGIHEKGIGVVESYLLARKLMMQNIYHHPKVRCVQSMMVFFLQYACDFLAEPAFDGLRPTPLGLFLTGLHRYRCGDLSKESFMQDYFPAYGMLSDPMIYAFLAQVAHDPSRYPPPIVILAQRLYHRVLPKIIPLSDLDPAMMARLQEDLATWRAEQGWAEWQCGIEEQECVVYREDSPILVQYGRALEGEPLAFSGSATMKKSVFYMDKILWQEYAEAPLVQQLQR